MTRAQALAEPQRRWGKDAEVHRYNGKPQYNEQTLYGVYRCSMLQSATAQMGLGHSWEQAFADADAREAAASSGSKPQP